MGNNTTREASDIFEGSHLQFAAAETAALSACDAWLAWLNAAQEAAGLTDLDGDEQEDGYSLDGAHDAYRQGVSAREYARHVMRERQRREAARTGGSGERRS